MKLSIITINLNQNRGLINTIDSVKSQTFTDYEWIIIDGGSNDGSIETIKENSPFFDYWISESDNGIYNAMNKGIKVAKGDYCLFLNAGDYLYDNLVLEKIFNEISDQDIIYGDLILKNNNSYRLQKFPNNLTFYWLYTEYLGHASTIIKRCIFNKVGMYNENYRIVSDWEFLLFAFGKFSCSRLYIPLPIGVLEEGGISNSEKYTNLVRYERDDVIKSHFLFFKDDYFWMQNTIEKKRRMFTNRVLKFIKKIFG